MAPSLESLGIDRLSVEDRIALVQQIWDSLSDTDQVALVDQIWHGIADQPLTEAQRAELERRWADDEANPDDGVPWEQVKAEALARWAK